MLSVSFTGVTCPRTQLPKGQLQTNSISDLGSVLETQTLRCQPGRAESEPAL